MNIEVKIILLETNIEIPMKHLLFFWVKKGNESS